MQTNEAQASPDDFGRWTAELESALMRELQQQATYLNRTLFSGVLKPARMELTDARSYLGRWVEGLGLLQFSRALVLEQPWNVVVEVLKHELAHQFVSEVYHAQESAHGVLFQRVCAQHGIDPSATGLPKSDDASDFGTQKTLQKLTQLLSLAQSDNEHEAQAAMTAAHRLMLRYNLEAPKPSQAGAYVTRLVGRYTNRITEAEHRLASLIGKHFFVEAIWIHAYLPREGCTKKVLEICGTPTNVELGSYVHSFVIHAAEGLWRKHKLQYGIKADRDRQTFLAGVVIGFAEKLGKERKVQAEQGLVWAGDTALARHQQRRYPRARHTVVTQKLETFARQHGKQAGRELVLSKPLTQGATDRVRALPIGRT